MPPLTGLDWPEILSMDSNSCKEYNFQYVYINMYYILTIYINILYINYIYINMFK